LKHLLLPTGCGSTDTNEKTPAFGQVMERGLRKGEQSGLLTPIATTESVSLCVRQQNGKKMRGRPFRL
jgi:hypothetical protein